LAIYFNNISDTFDGIFNGSDIKMKALKPSHREKKRYVLIKGSDANKKNIEDVILEFIGVLGFADACPKFIKVSRDKVVLCVNRGALEKVRASFLMSDKDLRIERVSGGVGKLRD